MSLALSLTVLTCPAPDTSSDLGPSSGSAQQAPSGLHTLPFAMDGWQRLGLNFNVTSSVQPHLLQLHLLTFSFIALALRRKEPVYSLLSRLRSNSSSLRAAGHRRGPKCPARA